MPFDLQLEWTRDLHQRTQRAISLTNFGIIVPERHSRLVRLNEVNGQALWEARINSPWGWLTATDSRVVYLNQHSFLQCFDFATGQTLWEYDLPNPFNGYVAAKGRYLIVGGWRDYSPVTCLDIDSGATLWVNPVRQYYAPPLLSSQGIVLASGTFHELTSLQLLDYQQGKIQFEIDLPEGVPVTDRSVGLQLAGGMLYAATRLGDVCSLDFEQQHWVLRAHHPQGIRTVTPSLLNSKMLFMDEQGQLCCYDLRDGRLKWKQALDHQGEFFPAAEYENTTMIGTSKGQLIALDDSGNRIWARTIAKRIRTNLFITDAGKLILGTKGAIVSYKLVTLDHADT